MILTPLDPADLPQILDAFDRGLAAYPQARAVFGRIAATGRFVTGAPADLHRGCTKAVALAQRLGIGTLDEDPASAFSWDGQAIRTRSETSVVFHEIAHWQIASPARRVLYDFGLGAGPETGRVAEANAAACVDAASKEDEENLASLLGILWETAHDEPAVLAFAEQNWLELPDRPHTQRHFVEYLAKLEARGLMPAEGILSAAA
ncbi:MAG: elongation factor P hydroxylase [Rhodospirillaceae bacterium]|nr:elongation factor P hydroxylase [Rhodospirillaceae bacterium]